MFVSCQKFLILGVSKSGYSSAKYVLKNGGICYVYEELKSEKIEKAITELETLGAISVGRENLESVINICDVVVLSPGVPINHDVAIKAKQRGKRIIGELEFGFAQFSPPIIAVTGTNGKTTTVSLIEDVLKNAKIRQETVGNVGIPITSRIDEINRDTVCVAEVSSFQLESVNLFCPHISCILNIAPDHLERHYTMENYVFLKKRIFKNQRESEFTLLNYDDLTVRSFRTETKGKVLWVSVQGKVDGAYRENGKLYCFSEYIMDETDLIIKGEHNVYNALFTILCARLINVPVETIVYTLKNFKGVKHRMELVVEKNGVKYFNDSKATNTASTISAIESMTAPTILILGGSEKGEEYINLFKKIKERPIKQVVLTGASRFNMLSDAGKVGYSAITLTEDFDFAIKIASLIAENGDCVLFSPACASFDKFDGFESRGEAFVKAVKVLP